MRGKHAHRIPVASCAVTTPSLPTAGERYLDLLVSCLTREAFLDQEWWDADLRDWPGGADAWSARSCGSTAGGSSVVATPPPGTRDATGRRRPRRWSAIAARRTWPSCAAGPLEDGVPGDFAETGVWRGGVTILMRAILAAYDIDDRRVWVADSFEGLPVARRRALPGRRRTSTGPTSAC